MKTFIIGLLLAWCVGIRCQSTMTQAPAAGATAPFTGTENAFTGTENPVTGTTPAAGKGVDNTANNQSTPSPRSVDNCYDFSCEGTYEHCFKKIEPRAYCARSDQFCKLTVQEHANGSTVRAECVPDNCEFTRLSSDITGFLTFNCCDSNLCNNDKLLAKQKSYAAILTASPLLALCGVVSFSALCQMLKVA